MALGGPCPLVGFDLAIGDSAILMDAATVVLGCLLSHPGQPFALGVGLVPEVGEEDEEDGPINPDEVDEDGELVLAAGHEVILGDVDGDNHKLCLGARQSRDKLFMKAGSGIPLNTFFLNETIRVLSHSEAEVLMVRHHQQQLEKAATSLKAACTSHPPNMVVAQEQQAEQHPHPNQAVGAMRGPQWTRAAKNPE